MPEQSGDKSQEATPHRRQEAREHGQVAKSQDLASAAVLLVGLLSLLTLGGGLIDYLGQLTRHQLGGEAWLTADPGLAVAQLSGNLGALAPLLLPLFGLIFVGAVAVNLVQSGFLFLPEKVTPDITRLDPLQGMQRLVSLSNLARLVFGLFKILLITVVALVSLYHERETILGMAGMEVGQIALYLVHILFATAIKIAVALLLLAILDYGFQRWKHEQDIRMTPQEVREEMKNLEGNPQVLARRRAVQRQLAMSRLSSAVPKADVVITNPTELAVAIQYEPQTMAAPIVVAKGAGVIAERIRRLALQHGIPIIEKKPLAQALFKEVDVNRPIPPDKYAAVAEVLAYVYHLQGKQIPTPPGNAA